MAPVAGSVSRFPEHDRAQRFTKIEGERAAFGLKVLYDCDDAEVEYVSFSIFDDSIFSSDTWVVHVASSPSMG